MACNSHKEAQYYFVKKERTIVARPNLKFNLNDFISYSYVNYSGISNSYNLPIRLFSKCCEINIDSCFKHSYNISFDSLFNFSKEFTISLFIQDRDVQLEFFQWSKHEECPDSLELLFHYR